VYLIKFNIIILSRKLLSLAIPFDTVGDCTAKLAAHLFS
jgi:hypothetical protein